MHDRDRRHHRPAQRAPRVDADDERGRDRRSTHATPARDPGQRAAARPDEHRDRVGRVGRQPPQHRPVRAARPSAPSGGVRIASNASPTSAAASGHTITSPGHSPTARTSNSPPSTTAPNATVAIASPRAASGRRGTFGARSASTPSPRRRGPRRDRSRSTGRRSRSARRSDRGRARRPDPRRRPRPCGPRRAASRSRRGERRGAATLQMIAPTPVARTSGVGLRVIPDSAAPPIGRTLASWTSNAPPPHRRRPRRRRPPPPAPTGAAAASAATGATGCSAASRREWPRRTASTSRSSACSGSSPASSGSASPRYIVAWIAIPPADGAPPERRHRAATRGVLVGLALVAIGVIGRQQSAAPARLALRPLRGAAPAHRRRARDPVAAPTRRRRRAPTRRARAATVRGDGRADDRNADDRNARERHTRDRDGRDATRPTADAEPVATDRPPPTRRLPPVPPSAWTQTAPWPTPPSGARVCGTRRADRRRAATAPVPHAAHAQHPADRRGDREPPAGDRRARREPHRRARDRDVRRRRRARGRARSSGARTRSSSSASCCSRRPRSRTRSTCPLRGGIGRPHYRPHPASRAAEPLRARHRPAPARPARRSARRPHHDRRRPDGDRRGARARAELGAGRGARARGRGSRDAVRQRRPEAGPRTTNAPSTAPAPGVLQLNLRVGAGDRSGSAASNPAASRRSWETRRWESIDDGPSPHRFRRAALRPRVPRAPAAASSCTRPPTAPSTRRGSRRSRSSRSAARSSRSPSCTSPERRAEATADTGAPTDAEDAVSEPEPCTRRTRGSPSVVERAARRARRSRAPCARRPPGRRPSRRRPAAPARRRGRRRRTSRPGLTSRSS